MKENDAMQIEEARKGLLEAMLNHSMARMAPRFSSKPIEVEDCLSDHSGLLSESTPTGLESSTPSYAPSTLTKGEREYLELLLKTGNSKSIRQASRILSNRSLFPPAVEDDDQAPDVVVSTRQQKKLERRDPVLQKHLFKLHEIGSLPPSLLLQRMSFGERKASILSNQSSRDDLEAAGCENEFADGETEEITAYHDEHQPATVGSSSSWNPFTDISSWIYGNQGVEVGNSGEEQPLPTTSNRFMILGTSADDESCHPHVLSPPLMEGIQEFVPESLSNHYFWLKYSLVRDGGSLTKMLRHIRASASTILAIETTEGKVFGSFTSHPWVLSSSSYYGSRESFVWRMRRSRFAACSSIVEQVVMEGELDVFPFTSCNNSVQHCSFDGIALGEGEVDGMRQQGKHHGHAISLEKHLRSGTTSTSETFGNPCLIYSDVRGAEFQVMNLEAWTLTPYTTIKEAERREMRYLFLDDDAEEGNLDLLRILVGPTPK